MSNMVGIDLGTSTSEIAILKDGKPYVIPNHLGEYITPSVVGLSIRKDYRRKRSPGSTVVKTG